MVWGKNRTAVDEDEGSSTNRGPYMQSFCVDVFGTATAVHKDSSLCDAIYSSEPWQLSLSSMKTVMAERRT